MRSGIGRLAPMSAFDRDQRGGQRQKLAADPPESVGPESNRHNLRTLTLARQCDSIPPMPVPPDRAWQLPWLRLHLFIRDVIATPWGGLADRQTRAGAVRGSYGER
jgi:hypothetical protein